MPPGTVAAVSLVEAVRLDLSAKFDTAVQLDSQIGVSFGTVEARFVFAVPAAERLR